MNNYFIIHGSFGNSNEHYLPWLKNQLEKQGEVVCLDFPIGVNIQNYKNWAKTLDPYKNKINKNSIFITRSIGCVFAIKYIIQNNLHIKKLVSISGFNNYFVNDDNYNNVNQSMYVDNLKTFCKHCNQTICIISENDPYVDLSVLKNFANTISTKIINIKSGGHFNDESGYGEKFEEVLNIVNNP
ncbi:MAG: alpha/beta hydrolase [Clostridia bacterium]|nr:alpha/beta hydrolase [Clostridia bacterium]